MSPRARRPWRALGVVAVLALFQAGAALIYWAVEDARSRAPDAPFEVERLLGAEAPDLSLRRADGSPVRLSELRGKVVLLHFWATFCPPCETELPGLLELAREHGPEGVVLLAVALDDDWPTIEAFFGGAVPPEVVRGVEGDEHRRYDVGTLPDTTIVGRSGQLAMRAAGARDWRSAGARAVLLAAVSEQDRRQ
jgi:thiol-disulfide isomerase/thioredoxin